MSTLLLRTLRDDPADAEVASHKLLVRAGYVRRIAAGIYSWLPLGYITFRNIESITRQEMDAAGEFDHIIVNSEVNQVIKALVSLASAKSEVN